MIKSDHIAGSSNGRTTALGAVYLGSNPSPAALPHFVRQSLRPQAKEVRKTLRSPDIRKDDEVIKSSYVFLCLHC